MSEQRCCDFCGRPESELLSEAKNGSQALEIDEDGLWVCQNCRAKLTLPTTIEATGELAGELRILLGENAGAICRTLNLPYEPPYRSIIDAAAKIAYDEDRYMSTWTFVTQWPNGTTVWRSQNADSIAFLTPDGTIRVQQQ